MAAPRGKKVLVFTKRRDSAAKEAADRLVSHLARLGHKCLDVSGSDERITAQQTKDVSLGVVIGGDGTFLTLVKRLESKDRFPLMGANLGKVGFITEFARDVMVTAVEDALSGRLREEKRPLLKVELWRDGKRVETGEVFNDLVVNKDTRTSISVMDIAIDSSPLSTVRADGYIISTPTGSTGYNLSAGGPLIHPSCEAMVLVPMCPHSLSSRPMVIPLSLEVEILLRSFAGGTAFLVFDGQVNLELMEGDRVLVGRAPHSLRLLRPSGETWANVLKSKLKML